MKQSKSIRKKLKKIKVGEKNVMLRRTIFGYAGLLKDLTLRLKNKNIET